MTEESVESMVNMVGNTTKVRLGERTWIEAGEESNKGFVVVDVLGENGRSRQIRMFYKDLSEESHVTVEEYLERHEALRKAGCPVVATLRKSEEVENRMLMSDVTENGKLLIVDFHDYSKHKLIKGKRKLFKQVRSISKNVFEAGYVLHENAFAAVVDPSSGKAEIVLLDLGDGIRERSKTEDLGDLDREMADRGVVGFMNIIDPFEE